jgi:hypothetical protein
MKKLNLLFIFLLAFFFQLHAQNSLHSEAFEKSANQSAANLNPFQSHINRDNFILPQKRNLFSPSNFAWKWDTIISYDASSGFLLRVSRTYNSFGYPLSQLTEQWQSNSTWGNYYRQTWTYDSAGNLPFLTYLEEIWQNNTWENLNKSQVNFNSNGVQHSWWRAAWDSTYWFGWWYYTYCYNSNGLVDSCILQVGQDTNWVNSKIWLPVYDGNGYMISMITDSWVNDNWVVTNQDTYTNDPNGHMLTDLFQEWESSAWVNNSLSTLTWDTAGHPLSSLYQFWQNSTWANQELQTITYDSFGNRINYLDQFWSNSAWMNTMQILCVYDTSHNMLSVTNQGWSSSSWQNQDMSRYTYDSAGNSLTGNYLHWNQVESRWIPYVGGLWVYSNHEYDDHMTYFEGYRYSMILDSILVHTDPVVSGTYLNVFPNPARSVVYVSTGTDSNNHCGSIAIYNLQGQPILTKQLVNQTTRIDFSGLKTGLYFVRFLNNQLTKTIKLVKE